MNILYAVGMQGGPLAICQLLGITGPDHTLHLVHVIDAGPREALNRLMGGPRLLHHPLRREDGRSLGDVPVPPAPPQYEPEKALDEAELAAGTEVLREARAEAERAGFTASTEIRKGRPEQIIVHIASDSVCQLIVIDAAEGSSGRPLSGPESIGRVARFVLDHAPCNVLLLRGK